MYVIQSTHSITNKSGETHIHVSYFERIGSLGFIVFTRLEDAKKYEFITEARREMRTLFQSKDKRKKIVKI